MTIHDVVAVILGGGRGTRLYPLTKLRAKPAVPIGGKYRLIDIPISNSLNSGIIKMHVLTQFLSASLHHHIYQTYKFDVFSGGFVDVLAAEETPSGMDWYQGTADAVRKQLPRLGLGRMRDALILSGDHLYRMDYTDFVELHRQTRADVTIAVHAVPVQDAPRYGVVKADEKGRVLSFHEKPGPDEASELAHTERGEQTCLISMGIYLFRTDVLRSVLEESDAQDFGSGIIPPLIRDLHVQAFAFDGYWEDIGTMRAFYEANLALTLPKPPFEFWDAKSPIYSRPRFLPPSWANGCKLERAVLAEGCELENAHVQESLIGLRSWIRAQSRVSRTVMMGADYYESPEQRAENRSQGIPDLGIGEGCSIEGAIIDKNARIGDGVTIKPQAPGDEMVDAGDYVIRDGIVVIPKNAVIVEGTTI
jgi:glucose-1-phosphate adenylyltransferase